MEIKELKVQIPEGYEIEKEKSTFEKIIFKKKDTKPRTWTEYCQTRLDRKETRFGYRIGNQCDIVTADWDDVFNGYTWRDVLPSKELANAFLAMMQLMSLRQDWIHKWSIDRGMTDDWKPDWNNEGIDKWCIIFQKYKVVVDYFYINASPLSFPTKELAEDFMDCFKDLLEIAKPLI